MNRSRPLPSLGSRWVPVACAPAGTLTLMVARDRTTGLVRLGACGLPEAPDPRQFPCAGGPLDGGWAPVLDTGFDPGGGHWVIWDTPPGELLVTRMGRTGPLVDPADQRRLARTLVAAVIPFAERGIPTGGIHPGLVVWYPQTTPVLVGLGARREPDPRWCGTDPQRADLTALAKTLAWACGGWDRISDPGAARLTGRIRAGEPVGAPWLRWWLDTHPAPDLGGPAREPAAVRPVRARRRAARWVARVAVTGTGVGVGLLVAANHLATVQAAVRNLWP